MQVFYHRVPSAVNELDDIALSVAEVVVDIARAGAYLVNYRNKVACCVIGEPLLDRRTAASRDHVHEHGAVVVVFGIGTVNYLAQAESVLVVSIGVGMRPVGDRDKLLAFLLSCQRNDLTHYALSMCQENRPSDTRLVLDECL